MSRLVFVLLLLLPLCGLAARDPELHHGQGDGSNSVADGAVVGSLLKRAHELKQQRVKASEVQEVDDRHELPDPEEDAESIAMLRMARLRNEDDEHDEEFCYNEGYRKRTLKLVKELPFVGLFRDLPENNVRFEASGICIAKGFAWVVFDSFRDIARLDLHFNYFGNDSIMVPDLDEAPAPEPVESQFEGLAYMESSDTFLVVRETFQETESSRILSRTEEIRMNKDMSGFHTVRECIINFEFEDTNKGFEGIYYFEKKGKSFLMGLCESNYCKTVQGDDPPGLDPGNGRLVIAELHEFRGGCEWNVVKVVNLPPSANFLDYSVISFHKYMGKTVAVASQEDAAVWVGKFDWDALEFYGKSKVFHFPRNEHCQKIYCNVEGLQFIDAQRVVLTSDKSKPIQPHACMHKDQSLAVMALPKYLN